MKILHITPDGKGYEVVNLLANNVNKTNSMAVIERYLENETSEIHMTGGYLLMDTPEVRHILDNTQKALQYDLVNKFKVLPFAKSYYEDIVSSPQNTGTNPPAKENFFIRFFNWIFNL